MAASGGSSERQHGRPIRHRQGRDAGRPGSRGAAGAASNAQAGGCLCRLRRFRQQPLGMRKPKCASTDSPPEAGVACCTAQHDACYPSCTPHAACWMVPPQTAARQRLWRRPPVQLSIRGFEAPATRYEAAGQWLCVGVWHAPMHSRRANDKGAVLLVACRRGYVLCMYVSGASMPLMFRTRFVLDASQRPFLLLCYCGKWKWEVCARNHEPRVLTHSSVYAFIVGGLFVICPPGPNVEVA